MKFIVHSCRVVRQTDVIEAVDMATAIETYVPSI